MTPSLRISASLLAITISLIFIAYSLGLIPSEQKMALEARARICESLAIQLASLASRNDEAAIKDTVDAVLARNRELLSIAVRGADGKLLVASGEHAARWQEPAGGQSTESFIQVPLLDEDVEAGKIEFVFRPISTRLGLALWREILGVIAFIGGAGLFGYYLVLNGVLRELDPKSAIPERIKAAYDTLAEGVLILDEAGQILLANQAFLENIHQQAGPLVGTLASKLPWLVWQADGSDVQLPWQAAIAQAQPVLGVPAVMRVSSGEDRRLIINATPILDAVGQVHGAIATFDDVTALHSTNEQLSASIHQLHELQAKISEQNCELKILASCDALTGCLNRRTFFAEAEQMLTNARASGSTMGFLMLDADHFKSVNDRFGHATGDKVLVGLAEVMRRTCVDGCAIGRYGGEEFCIAVGGRSDRELERLAEKLRVDVSEVTTWLPDGQTVTISIGVACMDNDCTVSDLVKRADSALYTAKSTGRNRFVAWKDVELLNGVPEQIRAALRDRRLYCEFQPKVEIGSHEVIGFEALVRWRRDLGRNHETEDFIRQAIELGMINQVTFFVLETIMDSLSRLDAVFGPHTSISLNVAAKLASDMDFMTAFAQALKDTGIADRLIIELTEESLMKRGDFHTRIIPLLHQIGVRVSIDDFGTGYSSLSLLADVMADEIKIDRSFVSRIHERPRNQSILRAINSLARSLGMNVVAEGVETFEELAYLQAATNIRQVQGFYFARPFHLDEIETAKRTLSAMSQQQSDRRPPLSAVQWASVAAHP